MSNASELATTLARVARSLPADQVELVGNTLVGLRAAGPTALEALGRLVPTGPFRAAMETLVEAWEDAPELDGAAVSLSLRPARAGYESTRHDSQVEVVRSGPEGEVDVHLTHAVLIEVIRSARRRLTLMSFAAYRVEEVTEALRAAASSGVEVRVVLDGGTDAARAFDTSDGIALYTWPPTLLSERDPHHASLHAKAAIADDRVAFVTSANLTGYALARNMELGLLVRGGEVPRLLAALCIPTG